MINIRDLRDCVVLPTLTHLGPKYATTAAIQLVTATGLHESNLTYLRQLHRGPAKGVWQMEPATFSDLYTNYLNYPRNSDLAARVEETASRFPKGASQMEGNLYYACAMCRVLYYRRPEPLPPADDAEAMGAFYKAHFNTSKGKATVAGFIETWNEFVRPLYN